MLIVSTPGIPVTGTSLPSYFGANSMWTALPSASVPWIVILSPSGSESTVSVPSFGAGPGLYLDLATLSFQVPAWLSAAWATLPMTSIDTATVIARSIMRRIRMGYLLISLDVQRNASAILASLQNSVAYL